MNSFDRLAQALSELGKVTEEYGGPSITEKQTQQAINILEDNNMRILKGWTKDEREELESAADNGYFNLMDLMNGIVKDYDDLHHIYCKYDGNYDDDENNQLAEDVIDYCTGKAKFPERKYVLDIGTVGNHEYVCEFNFNHNDFGLSDFYGQTYKEKSGALEFTKQTIIDHFGEKYMAFAVPVEE